MNNLSQTRQEAKELYLKRQQSKMLERYKAADGNERAAVIRNIDLFLSAVSKDERIFWLKFRSKLERLNERFAVNNNETENALENSLSPLSFNPNRKSRRNNNEKISAKTQK